MRIAMGDVFNDLLISFFEQSRAFLDEMKNACEQQDTQALERVFHSLGSSSINVGAEKLSAQARELEGKVKQGLSYITEDEINALRNEYVVVEGILKTFLSGVNK